MGEEREEVHKSSVTNDDLCLVVVSSHDVTNGAESGGLNTSAVVHEELNASGYNTALDDSLDVGLVGSVREVRERPAGIGEDIHVLVVHEKCESLKRRPDGLKVRCRAASAEVRQSPGGIAEHAQLSSVVDLSQKSREGIAVENLLAALVAVTSNVTEGPDGLLADILLGRGEKTHKDRDGASLDHNLGLFGSTTGNVGKSPGGLKLQTSVRLKLEKLHEARHHAALDNVADGGVLLN
mmetsp:Transcript_2217/g.5119  ORF Transcript_2217/g.5119 Transcript_2217/m.5119 type:complete len:238 (-) Transcript_2217:536-1249(-)